MRMSTSAYTMCGMTLRVAALLAGARVVCPAADPPPADPSSPVPSLQPAAAPARGFMGLAVGEIPPNVRAQITLPAGEGLAVVLVAKDSPASQAGLQTDDLLLRFEDQRLLSPGQFVTLVENAGVGREVEIAWLRQGTERTGRVTLTTRPPDLPGNVAPDPALMAKKLNDVLHILQDNPAALEAVHRILMGGAQAVPAPPDVPGENVSSGVRMLRRDAEGTVELRVSDGHSRLRACDAAGKMIFEGPFRTDADRAAVPGAIRAKGELLEMQSAPALPPELQKNMPSAPPAGK